ncbi:MULTISPECIES: type II toxin-antitoxin system death-on-curing family toxin [unclassified Pyramidobacter]|uniref:type II toxin-antitoxin system death-on-curing family toxin n=1 Tax=unclassified Pyramidobacter TaxID=2632171 RepID=UPI00098F7A92|nr:MULTISPECIES: type II toxin-antitoxin system death-on-curing family toxin [unclassified Pyramidobacter]OON89403.1 hypothetical protein B0D78_03355 [Pyramidobacter sp. C12-8]RKJ75379.1 type II toxin-antitoxin system death-on-curing family toxin [Pyramidobacter sp. CG50-2]WOL40670.1 type II toxin-antitoxin system death-on-curing family toxin [Pyramidobacter sp. YE332]
MPLPNIEWLSPESIDDVIESLRCRYADDPISIINEEPIEYVLHLEALSCYYDDDVYRLAAVIFRSIIQGHPLQDGNKRMGMLLGTYFLKINGYTLTAGNDEFLNTALEIARGELHLQGIYQWLLKRAQPG